VLEDLLRRLAATTAPLTTRRPVALQTIGAVERSACHAAEEEDADDDKPEDEACL
jgi:hypothetical protein